MVSAVAIIVPPDAKFLRKLKFERQPEKRRVEELGSWQQLLFEACKRLKTVDCFIIQAAAADPEENDSSNDSRIAPSMPVPMVYSVAVDILFHLIHYKAFTSVPQLVL